jgi:hypothetical protein
MLLEDLARIESQAVAKDFKSFAAVTSRHNAASSVPLPKALILSEPGELVLALK